MDRNIKWFTMPVGEQISNIGSEVERALRYKDKDERKMLNFLNKAIELIERSQIDPKNIHRIRELGFCKEELIDYFIGENIYGTTEDMLRRFYDSFI